MPRQELGIEYYLLDSGERRYRVRWHEDGKHKSRSFRRLSGETGARHFYKKVREYQEAGARIARVGEGALTLGVFVADIWAPRAERRLSGESWTRDSSIYNKHILYQLGERPIAEIDAEDLVIWQDGLEEAGVGAPTITRAMSLLSHIFREAARRSRSTGVWGNPVAMLERPSQKRRRRPLVWGPVVVERVRYELMVNSLRINPGKEVTAMRDALLVSFMEMTGCRPGEALAVRWCDVEDRVVIARRLSGNEIKQGSKTGTERAAPLLKPLLADLKTLRARSGDGPLDPVFRKVDGRHYAKTDWRNYGSRHFTPALERVEAGWEKWRSGLADPDAVRESVDGLSGTRPYDLGRHTHSALMLASGMSLQRLARIQGHSIRVLDETYSEQLEEFEEAEKAIDPIAEIETARELVWRDRRGQDL
jgi:integrase